MKSGQALKILDITRPTLTKYVKQGFIKRLELPGGRFRYDDDSVYAFLNSGVKRKTVVYARVSTGRQKKDLENQISLLQQFCFNKGYNLHYIYKDIASGISFEKRKDFFALLDEVIDGKIERVVISYKDRMSRVGFDLFRHLFQKYNCEIDVMSEVGSKKLDSEEIFEEIISMLHCYSMKLYSKRKETKVRDLIKVEK